MKKITCRVIKGDPVEVSVSDLVFRPSVYGVVLCNNKVLLVPQWDGYDFPGGGVDLGETIDEAFRREIKEETGLNVDRGDVLVAESDFFFHPYRKVPYNTILIYYLCKNVSGEISTDGFDEHEEDYAKKAEWVDVDKINSLKFCNPVDSPSIIRSAMIREKDGERK